MTKITLEDIERERKLIADDDDFEFRLQRSCFVRALLNLAERELQLQARLLENAKALDKMIRENKAGHTSACRASPPELGCVCFQQSDRDDQTHKTNRDGGGT